MNLSLDQIERMGRDREASSVDRLLPYLLDSDPHVRTAVATALGRVRSPNALPALLDSLHDPVTEVRQSAVWALGELGQSRAVNAIVLLLHDPSNSVRSAAVWSLGQLGEVRVLPELMAVSRFDSDQRVKQAAATVVAALAVGKVVTQKPSLAVTDNRSTRVQQAILIGLIVVSLIGLVATAVYVWNQPLGDDLVLGGVGSTANPIVIPQPESVGNPQCGGPRTMFLLLVGTDNAEQGFESGSADVIRVARIDFVRLQVLVLAIPRDLWVTIPGLDAYGISENRIKTAYPYGNHYKVPGRGVSLLAQTLTANFGLSVEHYVVIDFQTFASGIDQLGGVEIVLKDPIGLPGHADYFPAGANHMDGQTALAYARVRPDNSTDLARIGRQSQILLAARDKVLSSEGIAQLPALADLLKESARTDLSPSQFSSLLCLAQTMDQSNLVMRTLTNSYFVSVTDTFGYERLLPDSSAIRHLSDVFMSGDVVNFAAHLDN